MNLNLDEAKAKSATFIGLPSDQPTWIRHYESPAGAIELYPVENYDGDRRRRWGGNLAMWVETVSAHEHVYHSSSQLGAVPDFDHVVRLTVSAEPTA